MSLCDNQEGGQLFEARQRKGDYLAERTKKVTLPVGRIIPKVDMDTQVLHAGTERAEHIHIIITPTKEVDNMIPYWVH